MDGGGSPRPLPPLSGEAGSSAGGVGAPTYTIRRRSSFKNMAGIPPFPSRSAPPAAPGFFSDDGLSDDEPRRHFLDACFLCRKHLGAGCDIFMYRGDTPFCSEECRQEQIEIDEAREKRAAMKKQASVKQQKDQQQQPQRSSPPKSPRIQVRAAAGTVVAG